MLPNLGLEPVYVWQIEGTHRLVFETVTSRRFDAISTTTRRPIFSILMYMCRQHMWRLQMLYLCRTEQSHSALVYLYSGLFDLAFSV